jgi:hypothetical protein
MAEARRIGSLNGCTIWARNGQSSARNDGGGKVVHSLNEMTNHREKQGVGIVPCLFMSALRSEMRGAHSVISSRGCAIYQISFFEKNNSATGAADENAAQPPPRKATL